MDSLLVDGHQPGKWLEQSHPIVTKLHRLVQNNELHSVKKLLEDATFAWVDAPDKYGRTALHWAVVFGERKVAFAIIQNTSNNGIHSQDKYGCTPMHYAALGGRTGVARMLLRRGADINARDYQLRTPLHYAVQNAKNSIMVNLLLSKGADKRSLDLRGIFPYDVVVEWEGASTFLARPIPSYMQFMKIILKENALDGNLPLLPVNSKMEIVFPENGNENTKDSEKNLNDTKQRTVLTGENDTNLSDEIAFQRQSTEPSLDMLRDDMRKKVELEVKIADESRFPRKCIPPQTSAPKQILQKEYLQRELMRREELATKNVGVPNSGLRNTTAALNASNDAESPSPPGSGSKSRSTPRSPTSTRHNSPDSSLSRTTDSGTESFTSGSTHCSVCSAVTTIDPDVMEAVERSSVISTEHSSCGSANDPKPSRPPRIRTKTLALPSLGVSDRGQDGSYPRPDDVEGVESPFSPLPSEAGSQASSCSPHASSSIWFSARMSSCPPTSQQRSPTLSTYSADFATSSQESFYNNSDKEVKAESDYSANSAGQDKKSKLNMDSNVDSHPLASFKRPFYPDMSSRCERAFGLVRSQRTRKPATSPSKIHTQKWRHGGISPPPRRREERRPLPAPSLTRSPYYLPKPIFTEICHCDSSRSRPKSHSAPHQWSTFYRPTVHTCVHKGDPSWSRIMR